MKRRGITARIVYLGLLIIGGLASARGETPAKSSYLPGRPRASFETLYEHESELDAGADPAAPARVRVTETQARVGAPPLALPYGRLFLGLNAQAWRFQTENTGLDDLRVYALGLPVSWAAAWDEDWSVRVIASPTLYTDGRAMDHDAFRIGLLALAQYVWQPGLNLFGGLVYSRSFGSDRVFPALGASWRPNGQWDISLSYPRPGVTFAPNRRLRLGLEASPSGSQWRIREAWGAADSGTEGNHDLELKGYRLGAFAEHDLTRRWALRVGGGAVVDRRYEVRADTNQTLFRSRGENSWYASIALVWR
ncbi:MAG: DUF6268 family outer membrane beta-barrel protein [Candidatus Marinimicrobia bacterium]|nr:DUF6268 family outer membrane beta-barrel protein [Candidatus Neomarinimicrobiota bacterium]